MYGNKSFGTDAPEELTEDEREMVQEELSAVVTRTRRLLPGEFVVGSELAAGADGPTATVAVQPPVGRAVRANYTPSDAGFDEGSRDELAAGLAASAAVQVREALRNDAAPAAR